MAGADRRLDRDRDAALARRLAVPVESARALRLISAGPAHEMLCMPLRSTQPIEALGLVRGTLDGTATWRGRAEPTRRIDITETGRAELRRGGSDGR